jgi:hypothetical protein
MEATHGRILSPCNRCPLLVQACKIIYWSIDKMLNQKQNTLLQFQGIHHSKESSFLHVKDHNLNFKCMLEKLLIYVSLRISVLSSELLKMCLKEMK